MKKMLKKSLMLMVPALLAAGAVFAQNRETPNPASDFLFSWSGTITGYVGKDSRVIFPATIDGFEVTAIGKNAFAGNKVIREVVINNGIKKIDDFAFQNSALRWIRLDSKNLESMGIQVFTGTNLQSFPSNWPRSLNRIENYAFENSQLQGDLVIPEGIVHIGGSAFKGTKITSVTFPRSLRYIENEAFKNCSQLAGDIVIPEGVTEIRREIFSGTKIRSVTLPSTIKLINDKVFLNCRQLTTVTIPASVKKIDFNFDDEYELYVGAFNGTSLNAASKKALTDRGYNKKL
jgi:hypothetical protein